MNLSERITIRYVRHENGYSRIKYDFMCECGCDSEPFMHVVYPPDNKNGKLTKEQAKKLIIKKHEV
jgi:hypothetical protein